VIDSPNRVEAQRARNARPAEKVRARCTNKARSMTEDNRHTSLPPFPPHYRASGVLLHVTSLPSPYGVGDVGPMATRWIDLLHERAKLVAITSAPTTTRRINPCHLSRETAC
jgi:hypothetical protein